MPFDFILADDSRAELNFRCDELAIFRLEREAFFLTDSECFAWFVKGSDGLLAYPSSPSM